MAEINAWMQGGTMKKFVFLTVILSLAIVIPIAYGASYDCAKAVTKVE